MDEPNMVNYYEQQSKEALRKAEEEKYKAHCKDIAEHLHTIHQSFLNAGFSDDQAWFMTGSIFQKAKEDVNLTEAKERIIEW